MSQHFYFRRNRNSSTTWSRSESKEIKLKKKNEVVWLDKAYVQQIEIKCNIDRHYQNLTKKGMSCMSSAFSEMLSYLMQTLCVCENGQSTEKTMDHIEIERNTILMISDCIDSQRIWINESIIIKEDTSFCDVHHKYFVADLIIM